MAWRIVRQPNGLLARFSDVCDNFTHYDMDEEEAVQVCIDVGDMGPMGAKEKVAAGVEDHEPWTHGPSDDPEKLSRWKDCLHTIKNIHGEDEFKKTMTEIGHGLNNPKEGET